MTDMVEKVAKALIEQIGSPFTWEEMEPPIRRLWCNHARAAIRALMEPTEEMLKAGETTRHSRLMNMTHNIWQAMLKAALDD